MITQIDIANFGSFQSFAWKNSVKDPTGAVQSFKKLNIIYGRNYSGKTTLSRIFRTLEEKRFPANFDNPAYSLHHAGGTIAHSQIAAGGFNVRVYNKDFVQDNLSFLTNQQGGEIKTFAIVGAQNIEIVQELEKHEATLGTLDAKSGLRYDKMLKEADQRKKSAKATAADDALTEKLRRHANDVIKPNREYGRANYNINDIRTDLKHVRVNSTKPLTEEEVADKKALLKEDQLEKIGATVEFLPAIETLRTDATALLNRKIAPNVPIQELLNDSILQAWVKTGMSHHRHKRENCAFCRQPLPSDMWQVLDAHFSKESDELEAALDNCVSEISTEIQKIELIVTVKGEQFYAAERKEFDAANSSLDKNLKLYKAELKSLAKALNERKTRLFETMDAPASDFDTKKIADDIALINAAIGKSDAKTATLSKDKDAARTALRINDVANFEKQAALADDEATLKLHKDAEAEATREASDLAKQVEDLEKRMETLRAMQKDERKGAERVNALLGHFFGHDGLKLKAVDGDNDSGTRFQVMRGGKSAYNLSEGECSLVAFSYFMAKLEDSESKGKELVIYIDDPISSLDSNHVFFIFSIIEALIAKPAKNPDGSNLYRYGQLFISTHNLDFLKYLKRLSSPNEKRGGTAHFMIERSGSPSSISPMPAYLREYVTEFNYLFGQIYKCRDAEFAKTSPEPFYSFGNNLRKFLEAYLFYKFPCQDDANNSLERLQKFFGDDHTAIALVNRLSNELSHLEEIFDRSMRPIEIPEIPKLANFVLDKIYGADKEQYNSLLKSIGEPPREA